MACKRTFQRIRSLVVKSRGLESEGSRVRGLLEPESWPCVGAHVKKDESHVVIWRACKRTHNQYETSCGFRPTHGIIYLYASESMSSLSIVPDYQYQSL